MRADLWTSAILHDFWSKGKIVVDDEELLGKIAFEWRGACKTRTKFMDDYAQAVDRLIKSGKWVESPPPEDQLPHDMMPQAFFDYWRVS